MKLVPSSPHIKHNVWVETNILFIISIISFALTAHYAFFSAEKWATHLFLLKVFLEIYQLLPRLLSVLPVS